MAVWHDPRISRPPKLCPWNSAKNCRLIREYIRYFTYQVDHWQHCQYGG